jgi:hypothetical protein
LQRQQSHADHHAGRQSAREAHERWPRRRRLSLDGLVAAKFRGANDRRPPAFVGLADSWKADVWGAGHMGGSSNRSRGKELAGKFAMPEGMTVPRLGIDRDLLRRSWIASAQPREQ